VSVRPVRKSDYDQWLKLWDGYNQFYGRFGATALDPVITKTTWSRFFDENEPVFALVYEQEGKILGLTHYLFHRTTTAIGPNCYLQDLFSLAEARGKGIGRALIESVREAAITAKAARLYWQTHETNDTAMLLYNSLAKRSGFLVYGMAL